MPVINPNEIQAVMLAAGIGNRLSRRDKNLPPKCLFKFNGKSLLQRHVEALKKVGIKSLTIVVGFKSNKILQEIEDIQADDFVNFIDNDRFDRGSIVSLWCAREKLRSGYQVLFMDADVLYHASLVKKLTSKSVHSIIPYDRVFEAGDEPVKLCLSNEKPVEFSKIVGCMYDQIGEWPGFMRLSPKSANLIADDLDAGIVNGDLDSPYEESMRRVILGSSDDEFEFIDITGLPWIEIDFPKDLEKAKSIILPKIDDFSG